MRLAMLALSAFLYFPISCAAVPKVDPLPVASRKFEKRTLEEEVELLLQTDIEPKPKTPLALIASPSGSASNEDFPEIPNQPLSFPFAFVANQITGDFPDIDIQDLFQPRYEKQLPLGDPVSSIFDNLELKIRMKGGGGVLKRGLKDVKDLELNRRLTLNAHAYSLTLYDRLSIERNPKVNAKRGIIFKAKGRTAYSFRAEHNEFPDKKNEFVFTLGKSIPISHYLDLSTGLAISTQGRKYFFGIVEQKIGGSKLQYIAETYYDGKVTLLKLEIAVKSRKLLSINGLRFYLKGGYRYPVRDLLEDNSDGPFIKVLVRGKYSRN